MDAFTKKLLASLIAITLIGSVVGSFVVIGTAQGQEPWCPLNEDFSGSWLPGGWTTDDWSQSNSTYAGGASPEALLYWNNITDGYSYLDSKPVDTTDVSCLTLEFKSFIDDYCCSEGYEDPGCGYGEACGSYNCTVYMRADGSDSWTDVTPWSNPISGIIGPGTYSIDISSDIGSATQVRFEFDGYPYAIDDWFVDDVKICGAMPTNLRYLHAEDGLIDLGNPLDTQWNELYPLFGRDYHLSSWEDNGDSILSYCDGIDMYEKPDGAVKPYHVENVTITLNVTPEEEGEPIESTFIELEGGYNETALTDPIGTRWHEVYPNPCREYQLIAWNDTGTPSELGYCDYVLLAAQGYYGPLICPLDEDFYSWPPSGWTTDDWHQSNSNYAGGTSPEASLYYEDIYGDYAYLDSKPVDTTDATSLTLEFKSFIDDYCCSEGYGDPSCGYGEACGSYNCTVYTRADGSDYWTDVTPWSNPIYGDVGPNTYSVDISSDIGSATQVRFEFDGYPYALNDWYVDNVTICYSATWCHVEELATDIVVTSKVPPPPVGGEAYPVNKTSLLALWIAVAVLLAGGISWYALKRRRIQG